MKYDCFICDAPARAFVKNVKTYSGYFGCDKCCQEGVGLEALATNYGQGLSG